MLLSTEFSVAFSDVVVKYSVELKRLKNVELMSKFMLFMLVGIQGGKHVFSFVCFFQEKEELGDDASSPSVDSVTQENGSAESETNADNVRSLLFCSCSKYKFVRCKSRLPFVMS